ncbi:UNKNOWN [Stylonychia lemnae]|uniref:Uncharacterized protein n=1 Tax=Stylonychia lemnae TaxID=5949 RepID=A0A077ZS08_STYLE|nr:UNKNOWN [Stylonychia lemnae]|eukprot:CDW72269.1 UNKNOWN [Stylonychia lemnae]
MVQAEFLETPGRDLDFDQLNEENMNYSRFTGTQHQQATLNIVNEDIDPKKSLSEFTKIADSHEKERFVLKRSRQAQIGQRLMRIREEIYRLEKELNNPLNQEDPQSAQESIEPTEEPTQNKESKVVLNPAIQHLKQLDQIKDRLQLMYQTKGFQVLTKNQQHLKYLSINTKRPKDSNSAPGDEQNKEANLDLSSLEQIMLKIQKGDLNQDKSNQVTLVVDRTKQDIGVLVRLYSLQRRLNFIKYVTGEWKPSNKYKNMTEQIEYVMKRMEILDAQKLQFMQNRTKLLAEEILNLQGNTKEMRDLGHNKEEIEELYKGAIKVKTTMYEIHKYIERLEQKKKLHDMSAKVAIDIQCLEEQQNDIEACIGNNEKLFDYIKGGMQQNFELIKKNIDFLKNKAAKQAGK